MSPGRCCPAWFPADGATSSISAPSPGRILIPAATSTAATKAFVHQFSLNLRSDLHGTGLRVTVIEPGMCGGTEFSEVRFGGDRAKAAAVYAGMEPLTSEDIAGTILWATSRPAHVNINVIELMPVAQSFAAFQVARQATA
jgi:3-hydroxy acid dehydrogenase / malonic semialdehyde reductase